MNGPDMEDIAYHAKVHAEMLEQAAKVKIKAKPWWMPKFIYKAVIRECAVIEYKGTYFKE